MVSGQLVIQLRDEQPSSRHATIDPVLGLLGSELDMEVTHRTSVIWEARALCSEKCSGKHVEHFRIRSLCRRLV